MPLGALRGGAQAVPFGRVRKVHRAATSTRASGELFADFDEEPFALASLGQVHRARTHDGDDVAVKVQHPGVAEAVEADLRNLGVVGPILKRLAPGARRRCACWPRCASGSPTSSTTRSRPSISAASSAGSAAIRTCAWRGCTPTSAARRVLVTEYVDGLRAAGDRGLGDAERDRIGEIAFRFYFGLAWRDGVVAGDPHPDNCILCPDGRLCLLDFGLLRDLDADYLRGRARHHAGDRRRRRAARPRRPVGPRLPARAGAFDPGALLEHLATAGEWMFAPGFRRIDPELRRRVLELGYPPRSPHFALMRRMHLAAADAAAAPHGAAGPRPCSASCAPAPTGARSPPSTTARRRLDRARPRGPRLLRPPRSPLTGRDVARFHGLDRVVLAVGGRRRWPETAGVPDPRGGHHARRRRCSARPPTARIDRLAGLVEDAAVLAMVFSFMALAAAVIVAALVI